MKDIIESLYKNDQNYELYMGVLETLEGIRNEFGEDRWKELVSGNEQTGDMLDEMISNSGMMAVGVPESQGGLGGGLMAATMVTELLGSLGAIRISHFATHFCRHPVVHFGTDEQIEKWVAPTLNGEKKFCILVTEPNAGTNTFKITTRAKKADGKWILNGQKTFITNVDKGDFGLLVAKTDIDNPRALSTFVIDLKAAGISMQPLRINAFPMETQWTVFFDDVELPEEALLGNEGEGAKYMFDGLNAERILSAAAGLGVSDLALRVATDYVSHRSPFGQPIGSYQAVQHPLAQAKAETDAARLMTYHGVKKFDEGIDSASEANMATLLASNAGYNMVDAAVQFHGGSGLDEDTGLMPLHRLARSLRIVPVNNEMMLNFIAEKVIGLPKSYT